MSERPSPEDVRPTPAEALSDAIYGESNYWPSAHSAQQLLDSMCATAAVTIVPDDELEALRRLRDAAVAWRLDVLGLGLVAVRPSTLADMLDATPGSPR